MKNVQKEFLVGCLVIVVVILMGVFAWLMGALQPFSDNLTYHLQFNFAGGVEKGSPVRVAGVKVGKVESISFVSDREKNKPPLLISISVSKSAAPAVRQNSKFYVNMAGIIGERYIEISPGSAEFAALSDGAEKRGVDPPRIDQLLSQGYSVFGRIQELLEENQETVAEFLTQLPKVLKDVTQFMARKDWRKLVTLVNNVNELTEDMRFMTRKFRQPTTQMALDRLYEMVDRAYQIDKKALQQFLQEEGIRARIF